MSIMMILLQAASAADTSQLAQTFQATSSITFGGVVDIAYKLAMVAIAAFNIVYVIMLSPESG